MLAAKAIVADVRAQGVLHRLFRQQPPRPPLQTSVEGEVRLEVQSEVAGADDEEMDAEELAAGRTESCSGWGLVVTGHSLGAGAAALVGLALRADFPQLRVWSFAPPVMLSPRLQEALQPFTRSVVLGKDVVPRLSVDSLGRLRDDMVLSLARCPLNKNALLWRSLSEWQGPCPPCRAHLLHP